MGVTVRRLTLDELGPDLHAALQPKVSRLGYLGEFFAVAGHQPDALLAFHTFTEALKAALAPDLTEVVALTCATLAGNDYERFQHEQLALRQGQTPEWIAAACGEGPLTELDYHQQLVRSLAKAAFARHGHGSGAEFDDVVKALGEDTGVAVLLLVARYAAHAVVSNCLQLAPPVPAVTQAKPSAPGRVATTGSGGALPPDDGPGLWLSEADVVELIDMPASITALAEGLRLEANGGATNMVKTFVSWGDGHTLQAVGAAVPGAGVIGTKTWAHAAGGAAPLLVLFDSQSGKVRAVIEAFALGQLRTSAISGVATSMLGHPDADELAIVGTGKQALAQVAAVAAVRTLRRVRVFGRNAERAHTFAERVETELGLAAVVAPDVASAVRDAPLVTLVTRATSPFLTSGELGPGTHVNAVGAIVPSRAEFEPELLSRCSVITADSVPQTQALSREFMEYFGGDPDRWARVRPLSELVAADATRPAGADLTLFKAMGVGLSDLALGLHCLARARDVGAGKPLPPRISAQVRWSNRPSTISRSSAR